MLSWVKRIAKELIYKIFITCIYVLIEKDYDLLQVLADHQIKKNNDRLKKRIRVMGEGCIFNGTVYMSDPDYVVVGNNVHIGDHAYFKTAGGLTIGDNTHISRNVTIYTQNHNYQGSRLPYDDNAIHKAVIIEENVWIGMNVSIAPGVHVGEGAIIGIGTVVASDIPPFSIVGLPKYRIIKSRDIDHYDHLKRQKKYGGVNGKALPSHLSFKLNGIDKGEDLFFVVSTGRAGSTSIANTLNRHPEIRCYHEANWQLVRLSTEYCHKKVSVARAKEELKAIYCDCGIFPREGVVGESSLKLGNLIEVVSGLLPRCKFVWIVRNGQDFVSSAYHRGWFSQNQEEFALGNQWIAYRVNGFEAGGFSQAEWNKMTSFEKCCWYWNYWNSIIDNQLSKLDKDRYISVRLEDLGDSLPHVQSFLGVPVQELPLSRDNTAKEKIAHPYSQWNRSEKDSFQKICGEMMSRFYPSE